MEEAIERAIEGGWRRGERHVFIGISQFDVHDDPEAIILDPLFWQALGKADGWRYRCEGCGSEIYLDQFVCDQCEQKMTYKAGWYHYWHQLIDHLSENKPIDDFFNNLLK